MTSHPNNRSVMTTVRTALGLMTRRERHTAALIVAVMMLAGLIESTVLALVIPLVYVIIDPIRFSGTKIGAIMSGVLPLPPDMLFPYLAGTLAILIIASAALTGFAGYAAEKHSADCRNRMAREVLADLVAAPFSWILRQNSAVLARHVYEDVRVWRKEFVHSLLMIVQSAIMIVAPASVVFVMGAWQGLAALAVVGSICALVVVVFRKQLRHLSTIGLAHQSNMQRSLMQVLHGIKDVKVSGNSSQFIDQFSQHHDAFNNNAVRLRSWGNLPTALINVLGQLGFLLIASMLWASGQTGPVIAGQLALLAVVVSRLVPAFNRLAALVAVLYKAAPSVEALARLLQDIRTSSVPKADVTAPAPIPADWNAILLDRVTYRYTTADQTNLTDVSLLLERGKTYGIVGRSGAGKSTLINLILGLVPPDSGVVRIDDKDMRALDLTEWHRRVGYVPQQPFILDGTLLDNVVFGAKELPDDAIQTAIKTAMLEELVLSLPHGVGSHVGERGQMMSGGQAQRIALARALSRKPEILILDEATSALDAITEAEVFDRLGRIFGCRDMTTIIIAHRISTLRCCDELIVIDEGKVLDRGSYDDLMGRSAIFRGLAASLGPVQDGDGVTRKIAV